jgi:hypothetical protein
MPIGDGTPRQTADLAPRRSVPGVGRAAAARSGQYALARGHRGEEVIEHVVTHGDRLGAGDHGVWCQRGHGETHQPVEHEHGVEERLAEPVRGASSGMSDSGIGGTGRAMLGQSSCIRGLSSVDTGRMLRAVGVACGER